MSRIGYTILGCGLVVVDLLKALNGYEGATPIGLGTALGLAIVVLAPVVWED
jgi:hypothetical protein